MLRGEGAMRLDIVRAYRSVHTWTGILTGMLLFIAFYAGSLTVFRDAVHRWASPPRTERMLPLEKAQTLIVRTLERYPEAATDFRVNLQESEYIPARLEWRVKQEPAHAYSEVSSRFYTATLDADGNASFREHHPSRLAWFIDVLHRVVGLPLYNDPNSWFMGIVAMLYTPCPGFRSRSSASLSGERFFRIACRQASPANVDGRP